MYVPLPNELGERLEWDEYTGGDAFAAGACWGG